MAYYDDQALAEKYQISEREMRDIVYAHESFCRELTNKASHISLSSIQKAENEQKEAREFQIKKEQIEREKRNRGFKDKVFGAALHVGSEPSQYATESVKYELSNLKGYEEKFTYLCEAHRLPVANLFKDLLRSSGAGDAFRSYEYAKSRPLFSGVFR
jgi:hypothetical protein